jgi:hypothetical protein
MIKQTAPGSVTDRSIGLLHVESSSWNSSPVSRSAGADRFSSRCATDEVPGIGSSTGGTPQQPGQGDLGRRGLVAPRDRHQRLQPG